MKAAAAAAAAFSVSMLSSVKSPLVDREKEHQNDQVTPFAVPAHLECRRISLIADKTIIIFYLYLEIVVAMQSEKKV